MRICTCQKGKKIFVEGTLGSTMYEILDGRVGIYSAYGTDDQRLLTELGPGGIFGEMAVLENEDRSATAVVLEDDTEMLEVSSDELLSYFQGQSSRVLELMYRISRRTRDLTEEFLQVCGTLAEMKKTKDSGEKRSDSLLSRIKRFAGIGSNPVSKKPPLPLPNLDDKEVGMNRTITLPKDVVVFLEGAPADRLYEIISGSVSIRTNYGKADEKELVLLHAGEFFGEMGLLDQEPRSATAISVENNTVLEAYSADDFSDMLINRSEKVLYIVRHMSSRLRGLTEDYLDACKTITELTKAEDAGREAAPELQALASSYASRSRENLYSGSFSGRKFKD